MSGEADTLRAMELFAGLTEEDLAIILGIARRGRIPGGTTILQEGEHSDSLFILARGSVDVTKRLGLTMDTQPEKTRDKTIVRLGAPQFFGEMALLGDTERTATITASQECELLEITRRDFERIVESNLPLGYRLVHNLANVLCARLRRTDRDVLKLTAALTLALGNR